MSGTGPSVPGAPSRSAPVLPASAWELLVAWLPANDDPERPQITLATVDPTGAPDARTVLLSWFDRDGLAFNTDAASRKVRDIGADDRVALSILWPGFTRQLVVQGHAVAQTADAAEAEYARRSPYLQQLAWQNTHEYALLPDEQRRREWTAFGGLHPEGFSPAPTWTGYVVAPTRLTFWESSPDTASRRTEFAVRDGAWERTLLPG